MGECCHRVLSAEGEVLGSFPLLCVGVADAECCEAHGEEHIFPDAVKEDDRG